MAEPFIFFTCYDLITGKIEVIRIAQPPDEKYGDGVPEGMGPILGTYDPDTHYIDLVSVEAIERPVVTPMTGPSYDLALIPGVLSVTDEEGFETQVDQTDVDIELTDAGVYQVKSISPFPYIDFETEVIV